MKYSVLGFFLFLATLSFAQVKNVKLTNCVVIGQFDKPEDRFTIESTTAGVFSANGIKTTPSVNYVKTGGSSSVLAEDSLKSLLKENGFDTYVIVSVRGYDRSFKPSKTNYTFLEKLDQGTLREIYRNAAVSVSFEFSFYRNNEFLGADIIRCTNISNRDTVLKRYVNKLEKKVQKKWR